MVTRIAPEHWEWQIGSSNWYRLAYPPAWNLTEQNGTAKFSTGVNRGTLTIDCFWAPEADSLDLRETLHLDQMFSQRRNVRELNHPQMPYEMIAFEGESCNRSRHSWWKGLFAKQEWQRWRVWAIQHKSLCVVARYLQGDVRDPEEETFVSMVLNTLAINDNPADPPSVFSERVMKVAQSRFPLLKCKAGDGFQLQLGESNINLFNFYRSYVNSPEKFNEIVLPVLATVVQVQGWGDAQTEPNFEQVRDRILPMLYPRPVWEESFPNFIGESWVADLVILYVVDESNAYWYIPEDLLGRWDLTQEDLHELAIENLDKYFDAHTMEFTMIGEEEGPKILMPSRPDAYNTARLLSETFHGKLRKLLGNPFAVGIPNRDFFVAINLGSDDTIDQIRQKVTEDYTHMDHPLTDRLLLVSNDGVSEFIED